MKHFPIFLNVETARIVVSGGGDAALAKLRLILKTEARVSVFAEDPCPEIVRWSEEGRLNLTQRGLEPGDLICAKLFYAANEDDAEDARVAKIAAAEGALVNIVDNLEASAFITPAIVDRDPVTVAIGTEGAAPVLARKIKADVEEMLAPTLGMLARVGKLFRKQVEVLPFGKKRRDFWSDYYLKESAEIKTETEAKEQLEALLERYVSEETGPGHVDFVGSGPGDPELLTLKARKSLDRADVVIHDRLVAPEILELARREALIIEAGKTGFGPTTPQDAINEMIVTHARGGAHVVRLKSGDPTVFGRLDEEIDACDASGVSWSILPGITAASAAVASIGQSLTRRRRNSDIRLITGHDTEGFADRDWVELAQPGAVAAIYMGKKAARFIQGRLLMHGADPKTPVSVVENASRPDERIISTTLAALEPTMSEAELRGPAITFLGLAARHAAAELSPASFQEVAS